MEESIEKAQENKERSKSSQKKERKRFEQSSLQFV